MLFLNFTGLKLARNELFSQFFSEILCTYYRKWQL